jgi:hypothetical protein
MSLNAGLFPERYHSFRIIETSRGRVTNILIDTNPAIYTLYIPHPLIRFTIRISLKPRSQIGRSSSEKRCALGTVVALISERIYVCGTP